MRSLKDFSDQLPDDNEVLDRSFEVGKDKYTILPWKKYPTFSYRYLNIKKIPEYCFNHAEFNAEEYNVYFRRVKLFSNYEVDSAVESDHYTIEKPNSTLIDIIKDLAGVTGYLPPEQLPEFGHFHLSNNSKIEGQITKRPVIHFMVGNDAVFHILLYDPYHSVHMTKH